MRQPEPEWTRPEPALDPLISQQAGAAVGQAFHSLAGSILAGSQKTLDDVVRELLRPMLKEWLDDNLPGIVERLVRAEIERVARGGR
ncbi:PopZ family protein [Terrirubrum flagellatum]|uniref:PopZ family protein n=1 Tax=Terrirubrum flagellatum TaxID=2895980 RepID=UPI003CC81A20